MKPKGYSKAFKARVALMGIKGQTTANELASVYEVHASLVSTWKQQALEALPEVFGQGAQRQAEELEAQTQQDSSWLRSTRSHRATASLSFGRPISEPGARLIWLRCPRPRRSTEMLIKPHVKRLHRFVWCLL